MSGLAILVCGTFAATIVWGIYIGCKGMFAESPPFMQGEGKVGRFDTRMNRAA